jgi:hypothetical protein
MPQFDTLRINGLAAGEDAVVMMDALEATGCRDGGGGSLTENVFVSTGTTTHPNLMAPAGCNTELAIFTKNNAMKWETAVPWTNNLGDVHTVTLDPVIRPEVHIWVMDDATAARAQTHIDKAIEIYRDNRVGVLFQPIIKKLSEVATDPVAAAETVRSGIDPIWWDCLDGPDTGLSAIKAQPFYKANKLNVYYDDRAIGGKNCAIKRTPGLCTYSTTQFPPGDANITFLGTAATLTTLAHELGHAYGLRPAKCKGHTEGVTGFGSDNLMCTGSSCTNRSKLTLGQVFRMNTYANEGWGGTMLIPNDIPTRVPRLCKPDFAHSATCPTLSLPFPP